MAKSVRYVAYLCGNSSDIDRQYLKMQLHEATTADKFIAIFQETDYGWKQLKKAISKTIREGAILFLPSLVRRFAFDEEFLGILSRHKVQFYCLDYPELFSPSTLPNLLAFAVRESGEGHDKRTKAIAKTLDSQAKQDYSEVHPLIQTWRKEGLSQQDIADRLNSEGYRTRRGKKWSRVQVSRVIERFEESEGTD